MTWCYACQLGMGKMIIFRELVLSVQFTITIRLFDLFVLILSLRQITSFGVYGGVWNWPCPDVLAITSHAWACFSAAFAQRSKHLTAWPRRVEIDWIDSRSFSASSFCCLRRASKKGVIFPALEDGLAVERDQNLCRLDGVVDPASCDSICDLSPSSAEATESGVYAGSVKI